MDLHRLEVFIACYHAGSIGKVARAANISPQAVSKALSRLEDETGPLFIRSGTGLSPTALAEAIYPAAQATCDSVEQIRRTVRLGSFGFSKGVTLGYELNCLLTLPPGILNEYPPPNNTITFVGMDADTVFRSLGDATIDVAVASYRQSSEFSFDEFFSSRLAIVFTQQATGGHEPRSTEDPNPQSDASLTMLQGMRIFGTSPDNSVERELTRFLEHCDIQAHICYDFPSAANAEYEMQAGRGGAIVTEQRAQRLYGGKGFYRVVLEGDGAPRWRVGTCCPIGSTYTPLAIDLATFCRQYISKMERARNRMVDPSATSVASRHPRAAHTITTRPGLGYRKEEFPNRQGRPAENDRQAPGDGSGNVGEGAHDNDQL